MGIFNWAQSLFAESSRERDSHDDHSSANDVNNEMEINPASGLPMVGGSGGVDVAGNPYGCNLASHEDGQSAFIADDIANDFDILDPLDGIGLSDPFDLNDPFDSSSSFDDPFSSFDD